VPLSSELRNHVAKCVFLIYPRTGFSEAMVSLEVLYRMGGRLGWIRFGVFAT
jgi:hypothetical protein